MPHSQSVCTTVVQSRTFICILVLQMFRQSVGLTLLRPLTNTVTTCPWTSVSVASQGCPPPRPHSPPPLRLQPPPPRSYSLSPQPSDQGKVSLSIPHPKKKKNQKSLTSLNKIDSKKSPLNAIRKNMLWWFSFHSTGNFKINNFHLR